MILVCWAAACVFPVLCLLGGTSQSVALLWQPAIVGGLFLAGQLFTFLAVSRGDVSIVAPVLGVKILIVPAASHFVVDEQAPARIWIAAAVAVIGIGFVQVRDANIQRSRVLASVIYSLLAACVMTMFDLLIQRWAPRWGAGYFLPLTFFFSALFSLAFLPLADRPKKLLDLGLMPWLALGALLMAVQAIGMTLTLGMFGDATRVNIMYSMRGVWGVLFTWVVATQFNTSDLKPNRRTMLMRLIGAFLLAGAVVISVT
ncbi:MAG: DMT family transporter [Planctomycetaceae bacterium]|nr:DMT family transporter [Planctomycetaceae bacterium]